jgi:hypothetical protein
MVVVVFATFSSTAIASLGANFTQSRLQCRIASHQPSAQRTQIGTVAASFDALCHHLHHLAVEAGTNARFTVLETFQTGLNASFDLRVSRSICCHELTPENITLMSVLY